MDTDDYFWESTNPPYTIKRNVSDRIYDRGGLDMRSKSKHVSLSGSDSEAISVP